MRNIQTKTAVVIILLAFVFTGCDFADDQLSVDNQTKDSIAFIILNESNYFPTSSEDTSTNEDRLKNPALLNAVVKFDPRSEAKGGIHFLAPESSKHLYTFNTTWEYLVEENPRKQLEILFIPAKFMTTGKYKWKDLYKPEGFDKKVFTVKELDKNDWKVVYAK